MQAGGCKARLSSAAPALCQIEHADVLDRAVEPLNHAVGLQRSWWSSWGSIPRVEQSVSNAGCRVAACPRTPKRRSVSAFSGKMVRLRIGPVRSRSPRKRWALAAVLWRYMAMKTRRLTLSIATKRYPRDILLAMGGRYFTSMWVYPGLSALDPLYLAVSS